jgi:type I restriction enzyme S subunit
MDIQGQQTYRRSESALFLKTAERFGGLSNMAGGYPLRINGIRILTSEALYQACRFPHMPEIQGIIIGQASPMTAKMKSKPYRKDSRSDWDDVRVDIMWWCLRVKLAQNWEKFGDLLLSTEDMPIVEESYRDPFWGAEPINGEMLVGINVLGRLLAELRNQFRSSEREALRIVEPLHLPDFLLNKRAIGVIKDTTGIAHHDKLSSISQEQVLPLVTMGEAPAQQQLFG